MDRHGVTLDDLKAAGGGKGRSAKRGPSPMAGKPIAPKYKDKEGNSWAGRGRTPLWLVAAEKAGKKGESFSVE